MDEICELCGCTDDVRWWDECGSQSCPPTPVCSECWPHVQTWCEAHGGAA